MVPHVVQAHELYEVQVAANDRRVRVCVRALGLQTLNDIGGLPILDTECKGVYKEC